MVNVYYFKRRIHGAVKKENLWFIHADAEKPVDLRRKDK